MIKHSLQTLSRRRRPYAGLFVMLACVCSLSSCGDSGPDAKPDTLARVGTHPITRASVEHWMSVLVITDDNDIPKSSDPKRAVPQPPAYSACIANGKATLSATPRAQIKQKCALLHEALQDQAIEHLISTQQLYSETAERSISVSDHEVGAYLKRREREEFASHAAYANYLRITGLTKQDQLERARAELLTRKLLQSLTGSSSPHNLTPEQRGRLVSFARISKKWKEATTCKPAYAVPLCKLTGLLPSKPAPDPLIVELGL
jgi:hypothetical protein